MGRRSTLIWANMQANPRAKESSHIYWRINQHRSVSSTMSLAQAAAEAGEPEGHVVVADFQEQGRGTRGRVWIAPPGSCLMFSLLARPTCHPRSLADTPHEIAECLAHYLRERFALPAIVKPPNDVLVDERKICGVLCSSRVIGERVEYLLVGVGLNTWMTEDQLPIEAATSLIIEDCEIPSHRELLQDLLNQIGDVLQQIDQR